MSDAITQPDLDFEDVEVEGLGTIRVRELSALEAAFVGRKATRNAGLPSGDERDLAELEMAAYVVEKATDGKVDVRRLSTKHFLALQEPAMRLAGLSRPDGEDPVEEAVQDF